MSRDLSWLTSRPVAHRGLHDAAAGIVENSRSAVRRAIEHGYGIEIDVQRSRDGHAVVFHDDRLDRLTEASGPVGALSRAELLGIALRGAGDRIWTLEEALDAVGGRVPLVVELKSLFDDDARLVDAAGPLLRGYRGPVVAKSFDPQMVSAVRERYPALIRGCIGCAFDDAEWSGLSARRRLAMRNLLHWPRTRPDFLSWDVHDLPRLSVLAARRVAGAPVLGWTVRTPSDQARAALCADGMIFEGFLPDL